MGKFRTANKVILEMSRFNKVELPKEFIMSEVSEMHQLNNEEVGMAPLLASKVKNFVGTIYWWVFKLTLTDFSVHVKSKIV